MARAFMDLEIATGYGECCECLRPLCEKGSCVMTSGTAPSGYALHTPVRVCRHFLCPECAIQTTICPACGRQFERTVPVPDPRTQPMVWFRTVDLNQNGTLEMREVIEALTQMFPVEPRALERVIQRNWTAWDRHNRGKIDEQEFREYLMPYLKNALATMTARLNVVPPNLTTHPKEWFGAWDRDRSGYLDRSEIIRALIKTSPRFSGRDENSLLHSLENIWVAVIDPNNDGKVTMEEFVMTDGLRDTILANFPLNS